MELKQHQVISLFQALGKLDSGGTDGKPTNVSNFKFKASAIYGLSKNLRKLKTAVEDIEKARVATFKKYQDTPDQESLKGDALQKFVKEYNDFLDTSTTVNLYSIKLSDLDLDTNKVSIPVLSELLDTIVVDDTSGSTEEKK